MKASVDKETCIGCGLCEGLCDSVFYMDNDGKAATKMTDLPEDLVDGAKDAESSCPVNAITVV